MVRTCSYLRLLGNFVELPVDDHPADEHEEEDEAGRHPLKLVVDGKVGVEVQHLSWCRGEIHFYVKNLGEQEDDVCNILQSSVGHQEEDQT